ncbi:MAG: hypothetical protein JWM82_4136 [Myxococcales bacterium]|nr:hypothetical protein [Myxococcales bacterium]
MRIKGTAGLVVGVLGLVVVGAGVLAQGCGGGSSSKCDVGSESCPCTSGGICNSGLSCVSKTCVNLSGTDGGAGGTTGSTDPDVACADVSKYCQKYNECAPLLLKIIYGSLDACSARLKLSCKDGFSAPKSGLTAANIAACSAALPAASCSDVVYRKVAACQYKGTTDNGGACGTGEQCKSGYCAQGTNACGVCADLLKAGNTCDEDSACEPGLICSDDGHCVLPSAGGTACSTNQPCTYGYYCSPGNTCAVATNDPGGACNDPGSCNGFLSLFCSAGSCKSIIFANAGSTCGAVGSDLVYCSGSDCNNPDATATTGVCAARAKDGEVCGDTTANGRSCQTPALCVSGHCKLPSSAACL